MAPFPHFREASPPIISRIAELALGGRDGGKTMLVFQRNGKSVMFSSNHLKIGYIPNEIAI